MSVVDPVTNPELFLPESRSHVVYPVVGLMMALATTAIAARFYTRHVLVKSLGLDDWLSLLALACFCALGSATFVLANEGLGRHIGTLPPPDGIKRYLRTFWIMIVLYNCSITSIKLCFLAQYWRIMAVGRMRIAIMIVTGIVGIWSLTQLFLTIFQCDPIWGFWDKRPEAKCRSLPEGWYSNAASNIVADILIMLLPLPLIKSLNLPLHQRVVLGAVFCLGILTLIISIIRLKYLSLGPDITWDTFETQMWSVAEPCSGILCVVIPTLHPLYAKFFPRVGNSLSSSSNYRMDSSSRQKKRPRESIAMRRGTTRQSFGGGDEEQAICGPEERTNAAAEEPLEIPDGANDFGGYSSGHGEVFPRRLSHPDVVYAGLPREATSSCPVGSYGQ